MIRYLRVVWKIFFYFRGYKPQKITPLSVGKWLFQFPSSIRNHLFILLDYIIYYSEKETVQKLIQLNRTILQRLNVDGVDLNSIIYIASDSAGSSSHVMLNLLRDSENLERKGAILLGSRDAHLIQEKTSKIGSGAIIYVDDFAGTGRQFTRNRTWSAQFIIGSFSEFFLAPVICQEAIERIEETGIVTVTDLIHTIDQRPLHKDTTILSADSKESVVDLCHQIDDINGLGFKKLATMVVFYKNAPNTMPLVFRGNLKQQPYRGVFPRSDDLPY